jgi:hypothetical protein
MKGDVMTRNLLRLAVLVFVLSTTFWLALPRPALAITCGTTGDWFVSCTKKCCGPGVTTIYTRSGRGFDCLNAKSKCSTCFPACPAGQSQCGGITFGNCVA